MTPRTPVQIALARALETAISTGIVTAAIAALAAVIAALQVCKPPGAGQVGILGCGVDFRSILLAFLVAAGSGIVQYLQALASAKANVLLTGTTAPPQTVAAPSSSIVGGLLAATVPAAQPPKAGP